MAFGALYFRQRTANQVGGKLAGFMVFDLDDLRRKAHSGDPVSQFELGHAYHTGVGLGKDMLLALHWYHKAAEQGNLGAGLMLGQIYRLGEGIERNYPEAVK